MSKIHRQLLNEAVRRYAPQAEHLRDAAICITGAAGFLASSLISFLSELNRAFDLNLKLYANARRTFDTVSLFKFLDISPKINWDVAAVENVILPQINDLIVIHAASYGSPRDYLQKPIETYSVNTNGVIQLMSQRRSLRQFVYISSAEIYGQPPDTQIPTQENYTGGLDTLSIRSIYGESKRMGEVLGACLGEKFGIPFTSIRPWNIYGPGQRLEDGRVPMDFIRQAKQDNCIKLSSNGSPTRAFCYVWDAITQLTATLGLESKKAAFNIGNPTTEISILELAQMCAKVCGATSNNVFYNANAETTSLLRCAPDISSVNSLLSQQTPFTQLEAGLATLVEWHDYLKQK